MTAMAPRDWYPDPFGRYQYRYWDGSQWTDGVATHGQQGVDPPIPSAPMSPVVTPPEMVASAEHFSAHGIATDHSGGNKRVQRIVAAAGAAESQVGGGTLFTEPVLVVNQKPKLVEITAEYDVFNQHGYRVGAVQEVGLLRKMISQRSSQGRTRRLQIVDANGQILMTLTRPERFVRSKVIVRHPSGAKIGEIVQKTSGIVRKIRFDLEVGGKLVGTLNGEDRGDWEFSLQDTDGTEVARVARTLKGLNNLGIVRTDTYVVHIPQPPPPQPLQYLVVSACLVVDTVLRQGVNDASRGGRRLW